MLDIAQCPKVIVETDNGIDDFLSCGKVYTDNLDINRVYENLLEGSKNHLRLYGPLQFCKNKIAEELTARLYPASSWRIIFSEP